MSVIKLENVTKIFRRSHLGRVKESIGVEGVSFEVNKGEVFGILGLNGAGKTTTIKMLLGLIYPTTGVVKVDDKIMPDLSVLKNIGYLPEAAYISKYLTGKEALTTFAKLSGIPKGKRKQLVMETLDRVGMIPNANKRISDYSKGMMQRISMGQTLIHDPDVIIMDEPITGLDPLAIREVRQLITWLKSRGKTVFLSSHNISEVEKVCDRIGILTSGKLAAIVDHKDWQNQEGKLEKIFTEYVQGSSNINPLKIVKEAI